MRNIIGTLVGTPLLWFPVLCNIAFPELQIREDFFIKFSRIKSVPDLPKQYDLSRYVSHLRSRKPTTINFLAEGNGVFTYKKLGFILEQGRRVENVSGVQPKDCC